MAVTVSTCCVTLQRSTTWSHNTWSPVSIVSATTDMFVYCSCRAAVVAQQCRDQMCHLAIDYPVELVLAKGSTACAQHCLHVKSRAGELLACGGEQTFMVQCLRPAATYQRSTGFRDCLLFSDVERSTLLRV